MVECVVLLQAGSAHYHRLIRLPCSPFIGLQLWFDADPNYFDVTQIWWSDTRPFQMLLHVKDHDDDPGDDEMLSRGWIPGEFEFV